MTQTALSVARILTTTLARLLSLGLAVATPALAFGQAHGTWTTTGGIAAEHRNLYTTTLLKNGQVLLAGGFNASLGSAFGAAYLYNPSKGTWTETGSMGIGRYDHTATLLNKGEVLLAGGFSDANDSVSAQLYNPSAGTWSVTGSMTVARFGGQSAVLLQNGEVLVAGGVTNPTTGSITNTAEIYNPSTGTWTATGSMHHARAYAPLILLPNGEVLIAGGKGGGDASCTAELFSNGQWRLTANLVRCAPAGSIVQIPFAAPLPNGDVPLADANTASEFYDPSANVWQATLNQPNVSGRLVLLAEGKVLVAGDALLSGGSNAALYDPSTNEWAPTGSSPIFAQTLTRLLNGRVLATYEVYKAALYTP
jgi:hypothetical protein